MSSSQASLSAASDERKARLAKLKTLKRKQPADEVVAPESDRASTPSAEADVSKLHVSGRNYDHETRGPKLGFEAPPIENLENPTLEEQAADVEDELRRKQAEEAQDEKGVDLFKLQPKKPNWDLKRDLEKKLEPLQVRTDNAIAKLVRERITKSNNKGDGQTAAILDANGDAKGGLEGAELLEGVRLREKEEAEDERREKEDEELGV